jgi:hypothetical protein
MIVYNECNVDTNEEGNYHFPLISLLIHGKVLITTHFEWISYPLFSKKDLIPFRMWGSSSWKIKIAPFSVCKTKYSLHNYLCDSYKGG